MCIYVSSYIRDQPAKHAASIALLYTALVGSYRVVGSGVRVGVGGGWRAYIWVPPPQIGCGGARGFTPVLLRVSFQSPGF